MLWCFAVVDCSRETETGLRRPLFHVFRADYAGGGNFTEEAVAGFLAAVTGLGADSTMVVLVSAAFVRTELTRDHAGVNLLSDNFRNRFRLPQN